MVKSRLVMKKCPKCRHSAAVASKLCGNEECGYSFFDAKQKRARTSESSEAEEQSLRRTKRVRRENRKYSCSDVEIDTNEKVKKQQKRSKSDSQKLPQRRTSERKKETKEEKEARIESRKRRMQEMKNQREDICGQLSQAKQDLAALLLSEINRKLSSAAWRF